MKGMSHNADIVKFFKSTSDLTSDELSDWKETETKVAQQAVFFGGDTHD